MPFGCITPLEDGCFQWTIDNFLSKAWDKHQGLESPSFNFACMSFAILIAIDRRDRNLVKLSFRRLYGSDSCKLHVKLGMKTGSKGKRETRSGEITGLEKFIVDVWMSCSEMLERRSEILSDGCLTVFCELRLLDEEKSAQVLQKQLSSKEKPTVGNEASDSEPEEEVTVPKWKIVKKAQEDFGSLLISGEDSDVTIKVQGKEFPAHRCILRARCAVFKSMFSHDMVEKNSGVVVIDDCDPVTFPDFLNYIYTGSTKHIAIKNVSSLYFTSDKYGVSELKAECLSFMKSSLSVEEFCDIITLALRHDEKELVELATDFFCKHKTRIIKTPKWETFLHENTKGGNALLIKALSTE